MAWTVGVLVDENDRLLGEFKQGTLGRNWSGARDLNPRPHGPEPAACRVPWCPGVPLVSSCAHSDALSCPFLSFCVLFGSGSA